MLIDRFLNNTLYISNFCVSSIKIFFVIRYNKIEAQYINQSEIEKDWKNINSIKLEKNFKNLDNVKLEPRLSKSKYEEKIKKMLFHINRGDIYEANFCMEWFSKNSKINPENVYHNLNRISKTPMSAFFKENNFYLISSSPWETAYDLIQSFGANIHGKNLPCSL